MSQPSPSRRRRVRQAIAVALLGSCALVMADNIVVQRNVDVLSDKSPFSAPVETVNANASLVQIGKDGSFIHVRTPSGKEGWITEDDLPVKTTVSSVTGNGEAGGTNASLAGRASPGGKTMRSKRQRKEHESARCPANGGLGQRDKPVRPRGVRPRRARRAEEVSSVIAPSLAGFNPFR